ILPSRTLFPYPTLFRSVEFYDFDRGIWDFDWTNPVKLTRDEVEIQTPELEFDQIDLLILKEMYVDATSSLVEVRDAINKNDGVRSEEHTSELQSRGHHV